MRSDLPPLHSSADLATPVPSLSRGAKAAREFEAQLIGTLLASMEKTFAALPGGEGLPGNDEYNDLGTQALAQALAAHGGFGIAQMISRSLARHESNNNQESPGEPALSGPR